MRFSCPSSAFSICVVGVFILFGFPLIAISRAFEFVPKNIHMRYVGAPHQAH